MNNETDKNHKKHTSYYKTYSKAYYQKNKDKFKQYYQKYKLKKQQILNGTFQEQQKAKPKKTQQQKIVDRHAKIKKEYEIRRAKWLAENQHLFNTDISSS